MTRRETLAITGIVLVTLILTYLALGRTPATGITLRRDFEAVRRIILLYISIPCVSGLVYQAVRVCVHRRMLRKEELSPVSSQESNAHSWRSVGRRTTY